MAIKRRALRRRSCNIGKHEMLEELQKDPDLFYCRVCEHYLGDEKGTINFGVDRPMLPTSA